MASGLAFCEALANWHEFVGVVDAVFRFEHPESKRTLVEVPACRFGNKYRKLLVAANGHCVGVSGQ